MPAGSSDSTAEGVMAGCAWRCVVGAVALLVILGFIIGKAF